MVLLIVFFRRANGSHGTNFVPFNLCQRPPRETDHLANEITENVFLDLDCSLKSPFVIRLSVFKDHQITVHWVVLIDWFHCRTKVNTPWVTSVQILTFRILYPSKHHSISLGLQNYIYFCWIAVNI